MSDALLILLVGIMLGWMIVVLVALVASLGGDE